MGQPATSAGRCASMPLVATVRQKPISGAIRMWAE